MNKVGRPPRGPHQQKWNKEGNEHERDEWREKSSLALSQEERR